MNTKQLIAGLVILAAAGAAAAVTPYPPEAPFTSTKTRADVRAELVVAREQGLMDQGNAYPILPEEKSKLTRAQVEQHASDKLETGLYTGN
ncbi:DUF4148 domain-containing protein [Glaciimonas sp. PCH181]|uniref:DUF4148 domain-containing protein n=1 Tax=Glaciimonas sp. PCH181 TaxID=2133943 RepID=UPI000D39F73C|nr:DUF4148 domain-containing protein [Glaciimonas sp. PCH181]PUA20470.1 hypothetical protein C7W93_12185 [Glaciimonas sp. PCH181]